MADPQSSELVEQLRRWKPEITRLVAPSPFQQLCSEWRAADAAARGGFGENQVDPDTAMLEAATRIELKLADSSRPEHSRNETDIRGLLAALYTGRMEGRLEDGRVILRPRYEQGTAESVSEPGDG